MSTKYFIAKVAGDTILRDESMGSKRKFWYFVPGATDQLWLFKYPNVGTGEHWAERIAAEVAGVLGIAHARVELAEFDGVSGSTTASFLSGGLALVHGNQLMTGVLADYDSERTFHQSSHTLANIWRTLDTVFVEHEGRNAAKQRMAEYIVLDALIGNTDRHHENWGILAHVIESQRYGQVCPTFDHASSLGRELRDERRARLIGERQVARYIERGRGAVYWSEGDSRCPGPLEIARRAARHYPELFQPALAKLEGATEPALRNCVARVPGQVMSEVAREFAIALMLYNLKELRRLAQ